MLQILVLCLALCMDEFVASIAYGAGGISINWKETGVMNGIWGCKKTSLKKSLRP